MNNFDTHDEATRLADCHSGYALARMVIELRTDIGRYKRKLVNACFARSQEVQVSQCHSIAAKDATLIDELIDERIEIVAHVDRLRKAALDAIHIIPGGDVKAELRDAYDETPATNLARHNLLQQAEEADYIADNIAPVFRCELRDRAKYLRQQAKELNND